MPDSQDNLDLENLRSTLLDWMKSRISNDAYRWISQKSNQLIEGGEDWEFFTSFSAVPRHTKKEQSNLSEGELRQAEKLRAGWHPGYWSVDQLGRVLMVLSIAEKGKEEFLNMLDKTFISSDMGEAVALYQSMAVLPYPKELRQRAAEGIRSNITSVFNAVALRNPYPADYMDEDAWNQIVLKALFVESPLYQIQGIDERANAKLARMLVDYAHERWAAGRSVSPELWRPVGPFAEGDMIDDLKKVIEHPDDIQKQAAILALSASPSAEADKLLKQHVNLVKKYNQAQINWDQIGRQFEKT